MQQTFPAAEEHSVINATPVYNLRRRDTSTRRCPPSGHSAVRGVRKVSSKTMDPVTKLLRQKQRDEAKGYGHKALLAAEATAYSDESSETDSENEGGIVNLDEAHCEDILGKDGIAVSKILASDKQSDPGDNHVHEEGITLWEDCNETRNTINHIPPIPLSDSEIHASPVLSLLVDVVREKGRSFVFGLESILTMRQDCVMMSALINIENMGAVPYPQLNLLIPWLCDVGEYTDVDYSNVCSIRFAAFFSPDSSIALQAFDTLVKIPSIMTPVQDMVFPFTAVITTMYRLGAKFELLQELGWSSSSLPRGQYMVESRLSALFRLVTIVGIFAWYVLYILTASSTICSTIVQATAE